jgi:hypothetical protein
MPVVIYMIPPMVIQNRVFPKALRPKRVITNALNERW